MDVIDYLVDNGNTNILEAISAKDFLICILTILKTKHSQSIQCTILGLIKKWGETFSNTPNTHLSNFVEMYQNLKHNNVTFPNNYVSMYKNYLNKPTPSQTATNVNEYSDETEDYSNYVECIKLSLNPKDYNQKYTKLVNYLKLMSKNISLANEMIDMHSIDDANLKEIIRTLKHGNNRIIQTLASGRLKDRKLMEFTLDISADISRTMNRWERLTHNKKAEPFVSLFLEKNGFSTKKKKKKVNEINTNNNNNNDNYNSNKGYNRNYDKEVEELKRETNLKSADDLFDLFGGIDQPQQQQPQVQNNTTNSNAINLKMDLFDLNQQPIVDNYNYGGNMQFQQQSKLMPQTEDLQNKLQQLYNDSNNNNNMQNVFAGYGQQQFQQQQSAFGNGLGQISQPLTLPMDPMFNQGNNNNNNSNMMDYGFGNTNNNNNISHQSLGSNIMGYPTFDNNNSNNNNSNNNQQQFQNNYNQNQNNPMMMYSQLQNQQYISEEKYKEIDNLF